MLQLYGDEHNEYERIKDECSSIQEPQEKGLLGIGPFMKSCAPSWERTSPLSWNVNIHYRVHKSQRLDPVLR
jgi:hypothetical protein